MRRQRAVVLVAWAAAAGVLVGCSGGDGGGTAEDVAPASQSAPASPDAVDPAALCAAVSGLSGQPTGSEGVSPSPGTAGAERVEALEVELGRLSDLVPADLRPDLERLGQALDDDPPGLDLEPLGALARGLATGALDQAAVQRLDDAATSSCGQPLLGADALAAAQELSPRLEGDLRVVDLAEVYGAPVCPSSSPDDAVVAQGVLVSVCDQTLVGLDLTSLELLMKVDVPEAQEVVSWKAGGGVLALVTHEQVPQQGLTPARLDVLVHAFDVRTGKALWEVSPVLPPGGPAAFRAAFLEDLAVVGVSAQGTVLVDSPVSYACGQRIRLGAQALGRGDGSVAWRADHLWAADADVARTATGNDRGDCGDKTPYVEQLVAVDTGRVVVRGGDYEDLRSFRCSPWVQSREQTFSSDPPPLATSVTSGATVGAAGLEPVGFLREGVLVEREEDEALALLSPSGRISWSIPAEVSRDWRVVSGRLVITDGTGAALLIDPATGKVQETLSEVPEEGALLDDGAWERVRTEEASGWREADDRWLCDGPTPLKGA